MHAKREKETDGVKPAPVDLDRHARRAGEIIAQGATRRTPKKPRRRR
jgi:hypothetical protein